MDCEVKTINDGIIHYQTLKLVPDINGKEYKHIQETTDLIIPVIKPYTYYTVNNKYYLYLSKPCFQITRYGTYLNSCLKYQYDNILLIKSHYSFQYVLNCIHHYITCVCDMPIYDGNINDKKQIKKFNLICKKIYDHICNYKKHYSCSDYINISLPIKFDHETQQILNCYIEKEKFGQYILNPVTMVIEDYFKSRLTNINNLTKCAVGTNKQVYEKTTSLNLSDNYYFYNDVICEDLSTNKWHEIEKKSDIVFLKEIIVSKNTNLFDLESIVFKVGGSICWRIPFEVILKNSRIYEDETNIHIPIADNVMSTCNFSFNKNINYFKGFICVALQFHDIFVKIVSKSLFTFDIILYRRFYNNLIRRKMATKSQQLFHVYQKKSFSNVQEISFKMFNRHDYDGFYINILHQTHENIKMKILVNDKVLAKIDNITSNRYIKKLVVNNDKLTSTEYSSLHSKVLYESLQQYLPDEIISIIETYIAPSLYSMYYIPFQYLNMNFPDKYAELDAYKYFIKNIENNEIKISFNKDITCDVILTSFTKLVCAGGIAGVYYYPNDINQKELGRIYDEQLKK